MPINNGLAPFLTAALWKMQKQMFGDMDDEQREVTIAALVIIEKEITGINVKKTSDLTIN